MLNKRIVVKEVFKSDSTEEINNYLKEKIVKLMLRQQQSETKAV